MLSGVLENMVLVVVANADLIDILRQPTETLAVALSLQHGAHEQFQRTAGQIGACNFALQVKWISIM